MIGIGSAVGNYRVVKMLGSGAMGSVFLAEHPTIGKRVALKVIHPELAENAEMISRFFNEARLVSKIGHQNIVEVHDYSQSPDGDNFIVMEFLQGESLGDRIKRAGMLSVPETIHIAAQIADGLAASHAQGVIHRDLKPDNVFILQRAGEPDFVKILDFGLAKLMGGSMGFDDVSHKTRAGKVLGTPHYMAPEQCEGKVDIDHRVDIYALGCLMFHMLCGRVPFPGDGFGQALIKHLTEVPQQPSKINPQIPAALDRIILHTLAKQKEFRFQTMKELGQALRDPAAYARALNGDVRPGGTMEVQAVTLEPPPLAPPPSFAPDPALVQRISPEQGTLPGTPMELPDELVEAQAAAADDAPATVAEEMPYAMLESFRAAAAEQAASASQRNPQPLAAGPSRVASSQGGPPPSAPPVETAASTESTVAFDFGSHPLPQLLQHPEPTEPVNLPGKRGVKIAPTPTRASTPATGKSGGGRTAVILGVALVVVVLVVAVIVFAMRKQPTEGTGPSAAVPANSPAAAPAAAIVVNSVPPEAEVQRAAPSARPPTPPAPVASAPAETVPAADKTAPAPTRTSEKKPAAPHPASVKKRPSAGDEVLAPSF